MQKDGLPHVSLTYHTGPEGASTPKSSCTLDPGSQMTLSRGLKGSPAKNDLSGNAQI